MPELVITQVEEALEGIRIPPQPDVLKRIMDELQKSSPDMAYISDLIASDIGLSATVLKILNSPFFGLRAEIASITQAVSLLGLANITPLVNGYFLKSSLSEAGNQTVMKQFWEAASATAVIMAAIAPKLGDMTKDEAYTLGLFSRCGLPLLMQKRSTYVDSVLLSQAGMALAEVETKLLGTNHAQIGGYISKKWCLPADLVKAITSLDEIDEILSQHRNDRISTMVVVNNLAEQISYSYLNLHWLHDGETYFSQILAFLGLSEPDYEDIRDDMFEKLSFS